MIQEESVGESRLVDRLPSKALSSGVYLAPEPSFFEQRPRLLALSMLMLFVLASAIRLYRIQASGLLIDREYTTAIFARDFYFERTGSVEAWQKEIAHITRQNQPILEPPVTEYLLSLIYRVAGMEQFVFGRFLTSSFWLVGGIFLYKIARKMGSAETAVFATVYYLFAPLSILLSRSLQPDSLMMMLFLVSLFSIIRYYEEPSDSRLMVAAIVSGVTLLYRPLVLFSLFAAFTALAIERKGSWKRFIDKPFLLFVGISLLPMFLYYGYGIFIGGYQYWKVETSFRPQLLLHREYWKGWLLLGVEAAGFAPLILAFIGIAMLRNGWSQAFLVGLWVGYVVFGLAFTMHIHTHGYYHAQLIPIVALSLGPIVALLVDHLRKSSNEWYWWLPIVGALLLMMFFNVRQIQARLSHQVLESEKAAIEIGEIVNHSSDTVFLARYYGLPLQYYGQLSGSYWPRRITYWLYRQSNERELSVEERLNALGFSPQYFIITHFSEYSEHHSDLKQYLERNCAPLATTDEYLIYNDCEQLSAN